jgi:hypothetical protein
MEDSIYLMLSLFLLRGIIQKPTFWKYFWRKRILSIPVFGDVTSREMFKLIVKYVLFFSDKPSKKTMRTLIPNPTPYWTENFVDKSHILWNEQLSLNQYFPLK